MIFRKLKLIGVLFILFGLVLFVSVSGNFIDGIKTVEMDKKIDSKVFDDFNNEYLLVFFGYVGCTDICTPRLTELSNVYKKLQARGIDSQVVFINLIELRDSELPNIFATSFNSDFKGLYLSEDELSNIRDEFKVSIRRSLIDDEWNHSSLLYLLKKEKGGYYIRKIITSNEFDANEVSKVLLELNNKL